MNIHAKINKYRDRIIEELYEYYRTLVESRDKATNEHDWCYGQGEVNAVLDTVAIVYNAFKKEDE